MRCSVATACGEHGLVGLCMVVAVQAGRVV